ncbi:hypothetical protein C8Q78DRAFT_968112 [Trametes maxima]|nr:hypothetical protein C8Q78DRAFT_968112 [Trametes maxima]
MPKVSISSPTSTTTRSSGAPFQNAHVLRRNQACHQCRRRKLVSTAVIRFATGTKRPCSTCIRSHSYASAHAPPGADLPPHPECTFDEISEPNSSDTQDSPRDRFEQLESRINELEALLQEKEEGSFSSSRPASVNIFGNPPAGAGYANSADSPGISASLNGQPVVSHFSTSSALDDLAGVAALVGDPSSSQDFTESGLSPFFGFGFEHSQAESLKLCFGLEAVNPGWPRNLPTHPYLRHFVEAFLTFTPGVSRMFHTSTFLASLSLPAAHPKFPPPAVLHAMCAMGSMYTAAVPTADPSSPLACLLKAPGQSNTFAEIQIKAARDAIELALRTTSDLFGTLQAQIIVALWYWYNARWSEACVAFALSLRYAVPCGLNACAPFDSVSTSNVAHTSLIPPAANVAEDEMRRNTFWFAYMMERHFAAINNFAMMLDDDDVAQMLPVRGDKFEQGILVSPDERQWSYQPDVIETHLDDEIDSFILHVKATMLLSKVKVFNGRYKTKRHLGDPAMQPNGQGIPGMPGTNLIQTAPAFIELDRLIEAFKASLPTTLRNPTSNGVIDVSLLTALSTAHFATIILHEGHAMIGRAACISSCKVLAAARGILNLLHEACSTGHNLALLGVFPMICWFASGRVLIRFLKSAINAKSEEHIATLRTEVDFIRSVICEIGETVPHAQQYGKMLDAHLAQTCGKQYVTPVPLTAGTSHRDGEEPNAAGRLVGAHQK